LGILNWSINMAGTQRVKVQEDATPEEVADRISTLDNVMGGGEQVIVDGVQNPAVEGTAVRTGQKRQRMVEIRVSEDIEEMSYLSRDIRGRFTFKAGNRYRVPLEVALELENLGKVWH
jgi:hypothetical protein